MSGPPPALDPGVSRTLAGRRILLTGGGGFLAAAILARLREVDCSVRRLIRPGCASGAEGGRARVEDLEGDVQAPGVWARALVDVDLILHLAAQTSAAVADADPPADFEANVRPVLSLLEHCRRAGLRPGVVFASSATIAGAPDRVPVDETLPDCPLTAYDVHKQMAETYLRWYAGRGLVRAATLRLTNVYGPGPVSRHPDRGVLNQAVRRALAGEALSVYRPSERLRDYLYVDDAARAFLAAAAHLPRLDGRHLLVGSGEGTTLLRAWTLVAESVARATGRRVPVLEVDPPGPQSPIEARSFVADVRRFRGLTGWAPQVTLAAGIERTVESCLESRPVWRSR